MENLVKIFVDNPLIIATKLTFLALSVSTTILIRVLINLTLIQPNELDTSGYTYFLGRNQDAGSSKLPPQGQQLAGGRARFWHEAIWLRGACSWLFTILLMIVLITIMFSKIAHALQEYVFDIFV